MLKIKRTLLEMSENELEVVIKVISPGRLLQKHSKSDLQEEVIHWVLENGLRVTHEFTLIEMGDDNYGLLTDKNDCSCCQRSVSSGKSRHAEIAKERSEHSLPAEMVGSIVVEEINEIKSKTNPSFSSQYDSKSTIIGMQPLPTNLSPSGTKIKTDGDVRVNQKENNKQQKGGFSQCCAELGGCCISLLSNC
ncbi:hypothetical protein QQG55_3530 [Brugia pahangi]|uniref:Uncharacterized protein n=1 Tax=Brugia pahangi TaxID=6280 RepID=A0A0N4SY11_BRUPA|nr:unnamed protein product [Brugia pahangi]